ncbi:hypothetical protein BHE74_00027879 [Ensete ventricosum]|nr:hypothetical protein BHE74_00027879 [Ensete ventricosum]
MRDYGRTDLGMRDRSPTAIGALHASHLEEGEKKRQRSDGSREETSMRTLVGMNAASFCAILKGDISAGQRSKQLTQPVESSDFSSQQWGLLSRFLIRAGS